MPNNTNGTSQTVKGQIWDLHPMYFQDGMYAFAQNAVIENADGSGFPVLQNEPSNILTVSFPAGYKVVGNINVIEQNRIIWFLYNPTTHLSEIGETLNSGKCRKYVVDTDVTCDDCNSINLSEKPPLETITQTACATYRTIQSSTCLNFSDKFPINSAVYRIMSCTLQIFFTDNNNNRRWLEFNYINDDPSQGLIIRPQFYEIIGFQNPPCDNPIYGPDLDCNALNIQPSVRMPCIEYLGETGGGSLQAGVYQFFIAFSDINGNKLSSFFSATNPIPVRTRDVTQATNYPTDRAIQLQIDNLDPTGAFEYYILAVAKTIDNVTSFYLVGEFPTTQTLYTYTGNNNAEIKLTETDIFTLYPYYTTAGIVASSNGILYWANVNESVKPNLQRVANGIKLQWQTIAIPEPVYRDPLNTARFRSYMRDEVYPFGIQFIFNSGEESNAYHIPGRSSIPSDLTIISNDDVISDSGCTAVLNNLRWQVYNTATVEGGDLSIYNGCTESCYQYGNFSYWESTETYPNNPLIWGELCGQKIRHHKFPDSSVTHIHNYQNGSAAYQENNLVFPIGVKVDHDSVRSSIAAAVTAGLITAADAARIVGYRIVRGNRFGNKSVIAKGLLYDVNQYQRVDTTSGSTMPVIDQQPVFFANYPYNDLRANPFVTNDYKMYQTHNSSSGTPNLPFTFSNRYTFHSPDTHFNQPSLGTELKLEAAEYGNAEGKYVVSKKQAKQKFLSDAAYGIAVTLGIVRALLQTQPPEEISYTVRSPYKYVSDAYTVDSNGDIPYGNVTGTSPGSTITTPASAPWTGTSNVPQITTNETTSQIPGTDNDSYDYDDGTAAQPVNANGDPVDNIESWTKKTVRGQYNQYFSATTDLVPSWLSPLSAFLGVLEQIPSTINVILEEMNIVLDLIKSFTTYRDWCIQYDSVGKYNNYKTVDNDLGVKRRLIGAWAYLDGNNQTISEPVNTVTGQSSTIKFNNLNREDSVYLKYLGDQLPNAGQASGVQDTSRAQLGDSPFNCNLNLVGYTPISSYYASVKNYVANQYGTIFSIEYLRTDSCAFDMTQQNSVCKGVYGGDTFISRFALKVKVPYFLATTFNLPNGTDFDFSSVTNLAFPRNYYNNTAGFEFNSITDFLNPSSLITDLGRPKSYRACQTSKFFYQNGYIYLYHYGIPYFLCESDYNVDYRYATNNLEGDFYPHQGDLDFWLQEENVPINEPNTYNYNNTYSKQNKETFIGIDPLNFEPGRACRVDHPNRIIYADGQNWLVYKANNFYDFPLSKGRIISLEGIENQTVLVRTENSTSIFKSILRLQVDGQTSQVGNGGVFSNPPQDFGETTLGYIGTQHKAIIHTEFGHVWADAKRGQIFNVGTGASSLDEISKEGMKNWFKENLPFRILRDFQNMPETDIDNNFLGVGITMSFDKRYNRFLITKLDWKKIGTAIQYDSDLKEFYVTNGVTRTVINLGDPKYFKNCSWTASYNFYTKSWIAFHSYKPNYYVDSIDFFSSGMNGDNSSFWSHDLYNGSFQVFYGKIWPFIVEPVIKFDQALRQLNSVEFDTEVRRYNNEFDYTIKRQVPGFNKAIIYNDLYNSGILNLTLVDKRDMRLVGKYPIRNFDSWNIEVSPANYKWRFNQFFALNRDNSEIPMWIYQGNNEEKNLNQASFNYKKPDFTLARLKGQWFKERLINDSMSNYKVIFKFSIDNETVQFK